MIWSNGRNQTDKNHAEIIRLLK